MFVICLCLWLHPFRPTCMCVTCLCMHEHVKARSWHQMFPLNVLQLVCSLWRGRETCYFFASVTSHLLPESLHLPPAFQDYRWTTMHMGIDRDSVSLNSGFQTCVSSAFPTVLSSYPLWIILKTTVLYLSPYGYYNHISETI